MKKKSSHKTVKTSISLSEIVYAWAEELAANKGFANNFSAYIADLIRKDKDKDEKKSSIVASTYPPHRTDRTELNEPRKSKP